MIDEMSREDLDKIPKDELCFFHGHEPIPEGAHVICGECWHAWTAEALVKADSERSEESKERPVEEIFSCPLCAHDF